MAKYNKGQAVQVLRTSGPPVEAEVLEVIELAIKYRVMWWVDKTRHTAMVGEGELQNAPQQPPVLNYRVNDIVGYLDGHCAIHKCRIVRIDGSFGIHGKLYDQVFTLQPFGMAVPITSRSDRLTKWPDYL